MYNVAIVEDDLNERKKIIECIGRFSSESNLKFNLKEFASAEDFFATDVNSFNLLFMDIQLPGVNGMDACRKLREKNKRICIIFITNLAEYAIEGYSVDATDYILKPFTYSNFCLKMKKALKYIKKNGDQYIELKYNTSSTKIPISAICYVEVMKHIVTFHCDDEQYIIRGTMTTAEEQLNAYSFARCHKSFLVNLKKIKKIDNDAVYLERTCIPMGKIYKADFLNAFTDFIGGWN